MHGWVAVAAVVVAYDVWQHRNGHPTMSAAWHRWLDHRVGKPVCTVVWGGLTWHLFRRR